MWLEQLCILDTSFWSETLRPLMWQDAGNIQKIKLAPTVQQKAFDLWRLILVPLMAGSRGLHDAV